MAINKFGKGGFDSADKSFQGLGTLTGRSLFTIHGCTDDSTFDSNSPLIPAPLNTVVTFNSSTNYNPGANTDDGSCEPVILGCLDPLATNYNNIDPSDRSLSVPLGGGSGTYNILVDANTDTTPTSCIINGCTDPAAFNYDAIANTNDGSCIAVVEGCTDNSLDTNVIYYFNNLFTPAVAYIVNGAITPAVPQNTDYNLYYNFNPLANTDDGSCAERIYGCMQLGALNYDSTANTEPTGYCNFPISGCTEVNSCNYNALATINSGCIYCTDNSADNYDSSATTPCANTNLCEYCEHVSIFGPATTSTGTSITVNWLHNISTTPPLGAAVVNYSIRYRVNNAASPYYMGPNVWAPAVTNLLPGTTDYTVQGLYPSTQYKIQIRTICANTNSGGWSGASVTTSTNFLAGCMDTNAVNYDALAVQDNGSCEYSGCTDPLSFGGQTQFTHTTTGANYFATIDDGSCIAVVLGCTDITATNFDVTANTDDGSCILPQPGCLDPVADNYDTALASSGAGVQDNSCTYTGCTDPHANNYSFSNIAAGAFPVNAYYDQTTLTSVYGYGPNTNTLFTYTFGPIPYEWNNLFLSSDAVLAGIPLQDPTTGLFNTGTVTDDGTCTYTIYGCMNPAANNYFPSATVEDNSCCFGAVNYGIEGYQTDDNLPTGNNTTACVIGCTDLSYDNYSSGFAIPTVSVATDPHPSIINAADPGGCMNFDNTLTFSETLPAGEPFSITHGSTGQQMRNIYYSTQCDDGNNGLTSDSTGCPNMDFTNDYINNYKAKITVTVDNASTGIRLDGGTLTLEGPSNDSNGDPIPHLPFWSDNTPRSVAKSPDGSWNIGPDENFVDLDIDFRTESGKWLASKPNFLWNLIGGGNKVNLINDLKAGDFSSTYVGIGIPAYNPTFQQTLNFTFRNAYGAVVGAHQITAKVGCTDFRANNFCGTCNTQNPFSTYNGTVAVIPGTNNIDTSQLTPNSAGGPGISANWTICDYGQ